MADPKTMKRRIIGTVVSDKADKTVVITVERRVRHPIYGKAYSVTKKFHAHDERNVAKVGDRITIEASRPRSAKKRWTVVESENAKAKPAPAKEEAK